MVGQQPFMRIHCADYCIFCFVGKGNPIPLHPVLSGYANIQHCRQQLRTEQIHLIYIQNISIGPSQQPGFKTPFSLRHGIFQVNTAKEHIFRNIKGQVNDFSASCQHCRAAHKNRFCCAGYAAHQQAARFGINQRNHERSFCLLLPDYSCKRVAVIII